jgi:hypothetical protein
MSRTTQIHMDTDGIQRLFTFDPTIQPNPPHQISVEVIYPEPKPKDVWRDSIAELERKWGEGIVTQLQNKSYMKGGNCAIHALSLTTHIHPLKLQANAFAAGLMYHRSTPRGEGRTGCDATTTEKIKQVLGRGCVIQLTCGMFTASGPKTLNQFAKRYPTGTYYVLLSGHAVAVIDGVVYDYEHRGKRKIVRAWQI